MEATHLGAGGGGHFEHLARHIVAVVCDAHDPPLPSDTQASSSMPRSMASAAPHTCTSYSRSMAFRSSILPSATSRPLCKSTMVEPARRRPSGARPSAHFADRFAPSFQRLEHEITCGSVETVRRFVCDDHLWIMDDGAREFGGLPHARGIPVNSAIALFAESDVFEALVSPLHGHHRIHAEQFTGVSDLMDAVHARVSASYSGM